MNDNVAIVNLNNGKVIVYDNFKNATYDELENTIIFQAKTGSYAKSLEVVEYDSIESLVLPKGDYDYRIAKLMKEIG